MSPTMTDWRQLHDSFFEGSRVLVTGGAGFIGSHLAEALAKLGASVVVLDDLAGGSTDNLQGFGPVEFVRGSVLDRAAVDRCVAGCRFVFHQAALGSVPQSLLHPQQYDEVNGTGTLNVLEACRAAKVHRVMFAASSSAYGDSEQLPKVETMPTLPKSPYAATKVYGESLMRAYAATMGLDTAALRYFNIYGPRQNANSAYAAVIAGFATAIVNGRRPVIFGDGSATRDFAFVHNAVHANLLAARSPGAIGGEVINVACGRQTTINELARTMARLMGREDLEPVHEPPRPGDVKDSLADLSRARRVLGYEPVVPFEAGLQATVDWYAQAARR